MNFGILRLYVNDSNTSGFYNSQELGLSKSMAKLGYHCYIFVLDKNITNDIVESYDDNIKIVRVKCKSIRKHGFLDCKKLLDYNLNMLQIQGDNQLYFSNVIKFCKKNDIKYYTYIGTINTDSNKIINKLISKFIFIKTKKFLKESDNRVKTPFVKKELENRGVFNSKVLPVGLDYDNIDLKLTKKEILSKYNLPENKKFILFVGKLEQYKNPLELIKLSNKIDDDYNIVIIGKGSLKDKLLSNINKDNVIYFEQINNKEIHEIYSISDFFVNFNLVEIFGMSILEALYDGVTVIAYHAPGPDYILNSYKDYLVNNVEEMIDIINSDKKINSVELRKYIINNFSWDNTASIINKEIIGGNHNE